MVLLYTNSRTYLLERQYIGKRACIIWCGKHQCPPLYGPVHPAYVIGKTLVCVLLPKINVALEVKRFSTKRNVIIDNYFAGKLPSTIWKRGDYKEETRWVKSKQFELFLRLEIFQPTLIYLRALQNIPDNFEQQMKIHLKCLSREIYKK